MQKGLLFLTLNTFSTTGGIEKVGRLAGKALHELAVEKGEPFSLFSMYDNPGDWQETYLPREAFQPFSGNKVKCITAAVAAGRHSHTVVLAHINLLLIGYAVKIVSPKTRVLLIAHGIEVWVPLPLWKKRMLKKLDHFLPVSAFTGKKLEDLYAIPENKITVLNNCLDPFLKRTASPGAGETLRAKYGLSPHDLLLFTLTRIKFSEQYKGYDKVIFALPSIVEKYPAAKYLIAGKYDAEEKNRLDALITELNLEGSVIFTGFVTDEEVEACFSASDIYIMPSTGEGFGIVFIEALSWGKPVIAGNRDGSVDALAGGEFGRLIDPLKTKEIITAVLEIAENKDSHVPGSAAVQARFGFKTYKAAWKKILEKKASGNK